MRAITHAHTGATGIERHLQVMRGVAHHQHTLGRHAKFLHQLLQHQGVRFAGGLIGRARTVKQALQL
jgi:hypothetical protein